MQIINTVYSDMFEQNVYNNTGGSLYNASSQLVVMHFTNMVTQHRNVWQLIQKM